MAETPKSTFRFKEPVQVAIRDLIVLGYGRDQTDVVSRAVLGAGKLEKYRILAERAYPEPSGLCSRHRDDYPAECRTCYPDLNALIAEHNRLKQEAWLEIQRLEAIIASQNGGEIPTSNPSVPSTIPTGRELPTPTRPIRESGYEKAQREKRERYDRTAALDSVDDPSIDRSDEYVSQG
jgi:hypothetical protein